MIMPISMIFVAAAKWPTVPIFTHSETMIVLMRIVSMPSMLPMPNVKTVRAVPDQEAEDERWSNRQHPAVQQSHGDGRRRDFGDDKDHHQRDRAVT